MSFPSRGGKESLAVRQRDCKDRELVVKQHLIDFNVRPLTSGIVVPELKEIFKYGDAIEKRTTKKCASLSKLVLGKGLASEVVLILAFGT